MFKNYIKIALKVMMRNKLFTFISLFGISFTLFFLVVVTSLVDHSLGPVKPETRLKRTLSVTMGMLEYKDGGTMMGPLFSPYFLNKYVKSLESPQMVSISSYHHPVTEYLEDKKLKMDVKYCDSEFWRILDFTFLSGRGFNHDEVERIEPLAVINQRTRDDYFGENEVLGKYIEIEEKRYKVIGVVENVSILRIMPYADVWVPFGHSKTDLKKPTLLGGFPGWYAMVIAERRSDFPIIKKEFGNKLKYIEFPEGRFKNILTNVSSYEEALARQLFRKEDGNLKFFLFFVLIIMLIFMLLPAINLVNISISRIMERSSEIGVRKAFGASSLVLVGQFLVENIIITVIGGVISLALASICLAVINESGLIPYTHLSVNFRIFLVSLTIAVFFGIVSGVYPAFRMSRLDPANAIQGGQK